MLIPELLSPAGSLKAMRLAFAYGADAVYAGQPRYSLRVRNNEFDLTALATGIDEAHALGKKFYVVVNIAPHNSKLQSFIADMAPVVALGPDALIVSDPGVIYLLQQHFPHMALHLSVQANTVNWAAVKFWQTQGVERVILSRELAVEEIADIRREVPEMELEVFVHGALCMAYSGRCLLSGYINKRDPNQGACTNSCRWPYQVHGATEDEAGQFKPITTPALLEEQGRPGELMAIDEDVHGTYILNSKDLRAIAHVPALTNMGVHSLKIEGRTKSPYYVARTAQVYRQAIDDAVAGRAFDPKLLTELNGMANRGFTEGFLRRHKPQDTQNYDTSHSVGEQLLVGEFIGEQDSEGFALLEVKNQFSVGDSLLLMTPEGNQSFTLQALRDKQDNAILLAPGACYQLKVKLPKQTDLTFAMLLKQLPVAATANSDLAVNTVG
ncbi:MAG: U32 family peptidase [Rheinheimera sp.]|uniref:prephenate-dependent tRNA uridine(34) hydroxylase TrhP n=1 Tax=Arsukibacterium sp. UBA3155 TaxID=1946058 RepID=UPI000C9658D3|nr:tRNA 5-hydroxyuridine modification protein YegQ [Arsukibacterium sp. UBA3155]MAD74671.1 U32 family peptidase [Rheinheimera sp.]|tara:strand:- start:102613 stop:103932 length:1320 start_codon:yes stop_codon:yes gene_type:complete